MNILYLVVNLFKIASNVKQILSANPSYFNEKFLKFMVTFNKNLYKSLF